MQLFPVSPANYTLDVVQAALVLLTAAGLPRVLRRLEHVSIWWSLVLPGSIVACVAGIAALPGAADALTWIALICIPPGAAFALGWGMHGARPWLAAFALAALAVAVLRIDTVAGDVCGTLLTALSCVTFARLLAAVAPLGWLKVGLVAMAIIDAWLVFSTQIDHSNDLLNAAVPAVSSLDLPRLQTAFLDRSALGYGDLFVAATFGAILAAEGRRQLAPALWTLAALVAFDFLFNWYDTLPATVPVAVVLVAFEVRLRRQRSSEQVERGRSTHAVPGPVRSSSWVRPRAR